MEAAAEGGDADAFVRANWQLHARVASPRTRCCARST
ncbi:hypothetical protein ABZT45_47390 [Streptomyces sp. NPDC005356]